MKFLVKLGLILYNKDKQNVSLGGIFIMDLYTYLNQYHQIVLTDDQLAATQALDGPICVISCPGSGKTTVTVIRLANLILSGKVHPQQILALTFSKASARDMNERFQALFPKLSKQVQFSTIHSFAFQLIKHYQQLSGVMYQFIEGNQTTLHKKQLLTQFYIETTERYPSDDDLETLTGQISLLKNLMIEPHHTKEIKQYVETEVE
ncbi:AAA family ATPase, partial [Turicibacter sanguinis]|nr:AAA family ATPase [Turicibacter sanguinis]